MLSFGLSAPLGRRTYYRQHRQFRKCRTRHKNSLHVTPRVRRIQEKTFYPNLREVVWHQSLQQLAVPKAQPNPQPFDTRPGGKCFSLQRVGVRKISDEVHSTDIPQINQHDVSGGIQEFYFAPDEKFLSRNVALNTIAIHLANDYLLVRGCHLLTQLRAVKSTGHNPER